MRRITALLGLTVTALMLLPLALPVTLLDRARDAVFDSYQRAAPRPYDPKAPVHIIDIDEAALAEFGQWPWPRSYLAALTDRLFANGAVAVGFDILFPEPDRTSPENIATSWTRFAGADVPPLPKIDLPPHDAVFARAMAGKPVVLAVAGGPQGAQVAPKAGVAITGRAPAGLTTYPAAIDNLAVLDRAAAGLGTVSLGRNDDGITRTVPMVSQIGGALVPSLSAELLRVAQGAGGHILKTTEASGEVSGGTVAAVAMRTGALTYPLEGNGRFRVYFAGHQPARVTPASRVLNGGLRNPDLAARVAGKIVVVGSSAQGLFDIRTTPLDAQIAGVTLHAEILEQIVAGQFLTRPDWMPGLEAVVIVLIGAALCLLQWQERAFTGLCAALVLGGGAVLGGYLAFARAGLLFNPVLPVMTAIFVYLPGTTLGFLAKERARRLIRTRFAYFLPPEVIGQIEANPRTALTPEGSERELTVMFVDMRGFSTATEGMEPPRVVALINTFLSSVADVLVAQGATIDKFMGDAVMAFWNAPIARPDHKVAALRAIWQVIGASSAANAGLRAQGLPEVSIGVGVNSGPASVGLMGSRDRLSYTCIGDSVTLASRLEGLTRSYGVMNCAGPATVADCPPDLCALTLDLIAVKGFSRAVAVSTVLPVDAPHLTQFQDALAQARAAYLARDWDGAEAGFAALSRLSVDYCDTARLAALYQDRIRDLRTNPPPADWDGTFVATAKR